MWFSGWEQCRLNSPVRCSTCSQLSNLDCQLAFFGRRRFKLRFDLIWFDLILSCCCCFDRHSIWPLSLILSSSCALAKSFSHSHYRCPILWFDHCHCLCRRQSNYLSLSVLCHKQCPMTLCCCRSLNILDFVSRFLVISNLSSLSAIASVLGEWKTKIEPVEHLYLFQVSWPKDRSVTRVGRHSYEWLSPSDCFQPMYVCVFLFFDAENTPDNPSLSLSLSITGAITVTEKK